MKRALVTAGILTLALAAAGFGPVAQRIRPPKQLTCPRDHLTSFAGRVTTYNRKEGRTVVSLRTDEATDETLTLEHPGSDDPSRWFLLRAEPFTAASWREIESSPGRLVEKMRATAWVCDDGSNPIIDWQPPPP